MIQVSLVVRTGWRKLVILVADDNAGNQFSANAVLQRFGFKAYIVDNGADALNAYQDGDFELVLMDCRMPVMDGYEATQAIRKLEQQVGKHTPIIAVTAYASADDREKCLAAGMDDYMSKPISLEAIRDMLSRWVGTSL